MKIKYYLGFTFIVFVAFSIIWFSALRHNEKIVVINLGSIERGNLIKVIDKIESDSPRLISICASLKLKNNPPVVGGTPNTKTFQY